MKFSASVEEFAAQRRGVVDRAAELLRPVVRNALGEFMDGEEDWVQLVINACAAIWRDIEADEGGTADFAPFRQVLEDSLEQTRRPEIAVQDAQVERISLWLAGATVNAATMALADAETGQFVLLEWVTMGDEDVRDLHEPLQGVQRPVGETFDVGGFDLQYPGQPVGPPEVWINCRCVVRPVQGDEMSATRTTFAVEDEEDLVDAPEIESEDDLGYGPVPVHGVLAPMNVMSGDRRKLVGEITWVEPPFAIRWVKQDSGMHQGAERTATADEVWLEDGEIRWNGHMMASDAAEEHMNVLSEGPMGLSIDLDSAVFELQDESGNAFDFDLYEDGDPEPVMAVTSGRIRAATAVDIAAFVEAWMALGTWEKETVTAAGCAPCLARELDGYYGSYIDFAIAEGPWDGSASRFDIDEWRRSTLIDTGEGDEDSKGRYKLPIREPNGDINRAAVHNAAARIDQVDASDEAVAAGRRRLIAAYRAIDEEPPESLTASAFAPGTKDGPGWITNPRETARIRRYWTHGAGAAKIRWGAPGDFNRCRSQLRKYIKNPKWLAGTCANMHKEALGVWPGREGVRTAAEGVLMASAFTLVDEETTTLPSAWFDNPHLEGPTAVTVTPEGRVFGHVALWETCHIGFGLSVKQGSDCVAPPNSESNYAYFLTGVVDTDDGEVPTGVLTMGTGHAPERLRSTPAAAHYDNTGMAVADVNVGEDEYGIWFAGAMRPGLTPEDVRAFKASTLSGDWRTIKRHYEMVAALVVNVPGFPIPRRSMAASGGRQTTLVAAGVIHREEPESAPTVDMDALVAEVERRMQRKDRVTKARAVVRQFRLAAAREKIGL